GPRAADTDVSRRQSILNETYDFVARIQVPSEDKDMSAQRSAQLHAIDHLLRLAHRLQDILASETDFNSSKHAEAVLLTRTSLDLAHRALGAVTADDLLRQPESQAVAHADQTRGLRREVLSGVIAGLDAADALRISEVSRVLERMSNHSWRTCHYLVLARAAKLPTNT